LRVAVLTAAKLEKANLSKANLAGAALWDANLTGDPSLDWISCRNLDTDKFTFAYRGPWIRMQVESIHGSA